MPDIELASYQGQQEITEAINNLTLSAVPQKAVWFDNVASMVAYDLPVGVTAATRGYHTVNDGGGAFYYIKEADGSTEDGGSIIELDNTNLAELLPDDAVNVKQFGAVGDGTHDDTDAIQKALNFGSVINFPVGTYMVKTNTAQRITIPSNRTLNFEGNAVLKGINENNSISSILLIDGGSNIEINGGELYGDQETNTSVAGAGHGLQIRSNASDIVVKNLYAHHCHTDGCYVILASNILFDNCRFTNNGRMGHTITNGENIVIRNCYADTTESQFSPQTGFGIEPNYDTDKIKDIVYENCVGVSNINAYNSERGFYFNLNKLTTNNIVSITYSHCKSYGSTMYLGQCVPTIVDGVQQVVRGQIVIDNFVNFDSYESCFTIGTYAAYNTPQILINNPVCINGNRNNYNNLYGSFFCCLYGNAGVTHGNIIINNAVMGDGGAILKKFAYWDTGNIANITVNSGDWEIVQGQNFINYINEFPNSVLNITSSVAHTMAYRHITLDNGSALAPTVRTDIQKNAECSISKTNNGLATISFLGCVIEGVNTTGNAKIKTSADGAFLKLKWNKANHAFITEISSASDWDFTDNT